MRVFQAKHITGAFLGNLIPKVSLLSFAFALISTLFLLFSSSCEDPIADIGKEILGNEDKPGVAFSDTTTLTTYTILEDSVRADETTLNLIGSYIDPVFGEASAKVISQFRMPTGSVDFGSGPVLDSIVLTLKYYSYYGDEDFGQFFEVFELNEDVFKDSIYFSNADIDCATDNVGFTGFVPEMSDSVMLADSSTKPAHLRIKLADALGQKFIDASGTNDLVDNAAFLLFFKGLCIQSNNSPGVGQGAILSFDLLDDLSALSLYYHNSNNDSLEYIFEINSECARINQFSHDYSGTAIEQQFMDSTLGDSMLYIQSMSGVKTVVEIPNLQDWSDRNDIGINKAELVFYIQDGSDDEFEPPSKLFLVSVNKNGLNEFLPDFLDGSTYEGAELKSDGSYHFNLPIHFQNILNDPTNNKFYLLAAGSAVSASRLVLTGSKAISNGVKLRITHTQF